jgi:hypothetical protein
MLLAIRRILRLRVTFFILLPLGGGLGCAVPLAHDPIESPTAHRDIFPRTGQSLSSDSASKVSQAPATKTDFAKAAYGPPTIEQSQATEPSSTSAPSIEDTKALGAALAELNAQGAIDSATQTQLLEGLRQTDPALWPQLLAYFQSAAARRQPEKSPPVSTPETKLVAATEPAAVEKVETTALKTEPAEAPVVVQDAAEEAKPAEEPVKPKKPKAKTRRKPAKRPATETPSDDWQQQLTSSIEKLEKQTRQSPGTNHEIGRHATLRMLYLAAGRRDDALRPIEGISAAQQDFWTKEIYGLAAYLDQARNPDTSRRAAEANSHFREASARLGEIASLQVRNLTVCTEVTSYGVYKPFDSSEFRPGQELLLYAEIENFKSEHGDRGYHTALKASYQILDERGARVEEKEFAITEEYCQNPRRDFFIRYFVWIPQRIYNGNYTLQLSVEDTLSQKIGQASIEFKVKEK